MPKTLSKMVISTIQTYAAEQLFDAGGFGGTLVERFVSGTASRVVGFFFFQAEDGIRDYKVTGVQTCALPISPAFVMVDPFGVSGTPMAVLRRILSNPKCEVYVSFMYDFISRFRDTPEFAPHLDELFGCRDWRQGIPLTDPVERKTFFYGLYEKQLRDAGAEQLVRFELREGPRLVYAIFFATHSTKGADRMKEAIWKVVPFGDFAFRGSRSTQLGLDLAQADFRPLQESVHRRFASAGWVTIEQ